MSEHTSRGGSSSKAPLCALLFTVVAWIGLSAFGGTAFAQTTGDATNDSGGTGSAATGDALATGNSTGTGASQHGTGGGGLTLTNQDVQVTNTGTATANTGGNEATGNNSDNEAEADQDAELDGGDGRVVSNTGEASNRSNGSASITTGNATAIGNQSWTEIQQGADVYGDGLVFVDQLGIVTNDGEADADTGDNEATGNDSENEAEIEQELEADTAEVLSNVGEASNRSDGSADIDTGDADATGNESHDSVSQWATAVHGSGLGGINNIDQEAEVENDGEADADTGDNEATGNESENESETEQEPDSIRGPPEESDIVLSNIAEAVNESDGTAEISTGDASAIGNRSTTTITQAATGATDGLVFIDQDADVDNDGDAWARTGDNEATGNDSENESEVEQEAEIDADDDLELDGFVLSNIAESANRSDGTARITTGDAEAIGNDSQHSSTIDQSADVAIEDDGFAFVDQEADIDNEGEADADTGDNEATGNESENDSEVEQEIEVEADDIEAEDTVISNIGSSVNESDGTAEINTGDALATGNSSTDSITQSANVAIGDDGFAFVGQDAEVDNEGEAEAETGDNEATGNDSENETELDQEIELEADAFIGGDIELEDAVLSNIGEATNSSDGSASITTGEACANGNFSATDIDQAANVAISEDGFTFIDQEAEVENEGDAEAETGDNEATGNNSDNEDNELDQDIELDAGAFIGGGIEAEDTVLSNIGAAVNDSNGSADITTGDAIACGNVSTDSITQDAAFANGDDGFAFIDQDAEIDNEGEAEAETGDNEATGNDSDNETELEQDLSLDAGAVFGGGIELEETVLSNIGESSNTSDGSASIDTGDATASGNMSESNISQDAAFANSDDGFAIIDQEAEVENEGEGDADTGDNEATGNNSDNETELEQDVELDAGAFIGGGIELGDDSVLSNIGEASNNSNGSADITTGNAIAYGNYSTGSNISQSLDTLIADDGFVLADQEAEIENEGDAWARTGDNDAEGNDSENEADDFDQEIEIEAGAFIGGDIEGEGLVASNVGEASNWSDGSASIDTGNATAYGNAANNEIEMSADVVIGDNGFTILDQDAEVENEGEADADTGDNEATGNNSENEAELEQEVEVEADDIDLEDVVLSNTGENSNISDGSADIDTGNADAIGNYSATGVGLAANVLGGDITLADQEIDIENDGEAEADTGDNDVEGNDSENEAEADQETELEADGDLDVEGLVLANNAETTNDSDGSASADTGDARAAGNVAVTSACSGLNTEVDCPEVSLPPLPPPPCPCHIHDEEEVPVPEVPTPEVVVSGPTGEELPVTGGPLAAQAALGLLLVALGRTLRRRSQTAA